MIEIIGYGNLFAVASTFILLCVIYMAGYHEGAKERKNSTVKYARNRKVR